MYENEGKEHTVHWQKIEKSNFYKNKELFKIDDTDVNETLVSKKREREKKESCGTKTLLKYFIWYKEDDVITPLCIKLPQISGNIKCFDSNEINVYW